MGEIGQRVPAVGLDGCRGGWVAVCWPPVGGLPVAEVWPSLARLGELAPRPVLIDLPLGLADRPRPCDAAARAVLGGARAGSVFGPPPPAALAARDYAEACAGARAATGKAFSLQAWHLVPKLREAAALWEGQPAWRPWLREAHPEVLFAALNGAAVPEPKRTAGGRGRRLALLGAVWPGFGEWFAASRRHLRGTGAAADDLLDAAVLAWRARDWDSLRPLAPAVNPDGQVMAIWR